MIKRLLIANRGEIACRIMQTAQSQGIMCALIYHDDDKNALATQLADEAYALGKGLLSETYLNIHKIINIALLNNIDAIHPGYGFLSENPDFAKACEQNNIVFIGPSSDAITKMGIKSMAKDWVEKLKLPIIPGYQGSEQSIAHLVHAAKKIGLPILIKAAYGGGGKGMRIVKDATMLETALESAQRESAQSFGSSELILEKYFPEAYHIEIQVFGDTQGNVVHLFERNCSIQRRYQKIIEEAPAIILDPKLKQNMYDAAIKITQSLKYVGAGTIEFLVSNQQFYFMEMNTRLQVEHPVTEMITGQDLVAWQFRVAEGKALPLQQDQIIQHGHAIEARVYCEDPSNGFLPTSGDLLSLKIKHTKNIRIDSGVQAGDHIGISFDPLLSKIIAHGNTRDEAIQRLKQGLMNYQIAGPRTNLNFLQSLLLDSEFCKTQPPTHFIAQSLNKLTSTPHEPKLIGAFAVICWLLNYKGFLSLWRLNQIFQREFNLEIDNNPIAINIQYNIKQKEWILNKHEIILATTLDYKTFKIELLGKIFSIDAIKHGDNIVIYWEGYYYNIKLPSQILNLNKHKEHKNALTAPMPGIIRQIYVTQGGTVKLGEKLMIMEAMKMEHTISAPQQGIIKEIFYHIGDQVTEGTELLDFESTHE